MEGDNNDHVSLMLWMILGVDNSNGSRKQFLVSRPSRMWSFEFGDCIDTKQGEVAVSVSVTH